MARPAATEQWIDPNRWVRSVNSQSAGSRSNAGPRRSAPALVIITSMRPKRSTPVATIPWAPDGSATVSSFATASPPSAAISSATEAADAASTSLTTTRAPSLA